MTRFLVSDEKPDGYKLEDILTVLRNDVITRCGRIAEDKRPEAQHVLNNNIKILQLLEDAVKLSEDSSHVLDKAFGPSQASKGGPPRIGS
ncbi:hypothetical protein [Aestuariispira ectoiniformans]|uniref:hypothetical protein n=1 Tax=Aestuariispira ectoiniformans TaxID=2775080 RepID=UPI00223AB46D|nr:hypothetical protein [Aestuariispira ectoiniformans]